jgi:hypothetical protein
LHFLHRGILLLAAIAHFGVAKTLQVAQKHCRVGCHKTPLAVDSCPSKLGRPAEDALLSPLQTGNDATSMVDMPALQLQRSTVLQANTADVLEVGVLGLGLPLAPARRHRNHVRSADDFY